LRRILIIERNPLDAAKVRAVLPFYKKNEELKKKEINLKLEKRCSH